MKQNSVGLVKRANRSLVIEAIKNNECLTIEGIVSTVKLSRPTVLGILKDLTNENLVIKRGFAQSEIGRQPVLYSINSKGFFAIGIDVDGPPVHLTISDLNGAPIFNAHWDINLEDTGENITNIIIDQLKKSIAEAGIDEQTILGLCIGLPAVVNIKKNSISFISRIKCLEAFPFAELISNQTGLEVYIRNDAHLLGLAESGLKGASGDVLYIAHRSGIGMAPIIDGIQFYGTNGNAGYIGHSTINAQGRLCDCGNVGCLETYCSKRAIVSDYFEFTKKKRAYQEIVKLADEGDESAIKVFSEAGRILGMGVSNAIKMYDIPEAYIGGLGCSEKHVFFKSISDSVRTNTASFSAVSPKLYLGKIKESNFGLGGCHYILRNFFSLPKLKVSMKAL